MNNFWNSFSFRKTLEHEQREKQSLLCVWLDPKISGIPEELKELRRYSNEEVYWQWMKWIVDATADYATMFKPQSAHWEAIIWWKKILRKLVKYIKETYPNIVIFEDCKRWDIWSTQEKYQRAILWLDWVHWMNFSPYMWRECYESLRKKLTKDDDFHWHSIVSLCRTSNPGAWSMQDPLLMNWKKYYEKVASDMLRWTTESEDTNWWLVMWAAHKYKSFDLLRMEAEADPILFDIPVWNPDDYYNWHLEAVRAIVKDKLWFLIPWIWSQTWSTEENEKALIATIEASFVGWWSTAISSSSWISEAHLKEEYSSFDWQLAANIEAGFLANKMSERTQIILWRNQ